MTTLKTFRHITTYTLAFIVYTLLLAHAHATVGGSTYIGSFTYNPADESVYFIENSLTGRGCPPELKKISLVSETVAAAFSCNQGEALQQPGAYIDVGPKVLKEISKITTGFKHLTSLSLPKNNIRIDVTLIDSESLESEPEWIFKSHFTATVYQNHIKIDEFSIEGCNIEQPFIFSGYAIPGFEKKIVLLSSTKGDCFEGGYVTERLHVVGDVTFIDNTITSNQYKSSTIPLTPDETTLVVLEPDTVISVETSDPTKKYGATILGILLGFVIGIYVGKMYVKRK
jgi:hypothetical protein